MSLTRTLFGHLRGGGTRKLIFVWAAGLIGAVLALVTPSQVGRLTNLFANGSSPQWAPVHQAVLYMIGAQLALSFVVYWRKRMETALQESLIRSLAMEVFSRMLRFSPDFFAETEVARINARALEDTNSVGRYWASAFVGLPLAIASLAVFGWMMIRSNWLLGLCMIPLAALSGYFVLLDRKIQNVNRKARETWDGIRAQGHEVTASVAELRNHHAFDYGLGGLSRSFDRFRGTMTDIGVINALFQAMDPLVGCIQMGVLFWLGAALCIGGAGLSGWAGRMSWGDVISFSLLAQLFQRPVSDLANFFLQWRMTRENGRRVEEYLQRPCAFTRRDGAAPVAASPRIQFDNVTVLAPSGARILGAFDACVEPGEHVALCGPAGCGKSTAIGVLTHNIIPPSGRLLLGGASLGDIDLISVAAQIGFVPQKPVILNTSIRNNLLLGLRRPAQRAIEDDGWPVDLGRLPRVNSREDLNAALLDVIQRVGLEVDIFRKCLDMPAASLTASSADAESLKSRVMAAARAIRAKILSDGTSAIIPNAAAGQWRDELTVRENLLGGSIDVRRHGAPEAIDAAIQQTLAEMDLLGLFMQCGLEYRVGEEGRFLSGGQKQKIAIARVLLKNPSILLMDEATAAMDEVSQRRIVDLVRQDFKGRTVICISHRLSTIRDYDRILVLDRGQLVQQGSYDALSGQDGVFRQLVSHESSPAAGPSASHPAVAPPAPPQAPVAVDLQRELSLSPLFSQMRSEQLAFLAGIAKVVECEPNQTLFNRGDAGNELYVILSGEVEFVPDTGADAVATYGPGRSFGEIAVFTNGVRTLSARAKTRCRLCAIQRDDLLKLIDGNPRIAINLLQGLSSRLAELS